MSFAHFFSPAFKNTLHSGHIHSSPGSISRKRKRRGSDSGNVVNSHESELGKRLGSGGYPGRIKTAPTPSKLIHNSATTSEQPRALDQAIKQPSSPEIYGKNFPHAKLGCNAGDLMQDTKGGIQDTFVMARPHLSVDSRRYKSDLLVGGTPDSIGFRQQHLVALTTLLHRCILQGEYVRAGRAWGILLRTEVDGVSMDVRTYDRWGIGAELLCQRPSQRKKTTPMQQTNMVDDGYDNDAESSNWFSREGFEEARDYYERLILQYPYRKGFSNTVGALVFYPAMFGLWIYSEQQQYELLLSTLRAADVQPDQTKVLAGHRDLSPNPRIQNHLADMRNDFLLRAQQIGTRLKELLTSPPFSDDARLGRLQGMVTQWIENLSVAVLPRE